MDMGSVVDGFDGERVGDGLGDKFMGKRGVQRTLAGKKLFVAQRIRVAIGEGGTAAGAEVVSDDDIGDGVVCGGDDEGFECEGVGRSESRSRCAGLDEKRLFDDGIKRHVHGERGAGVEKHHGQKQ